MTGIWEYPDLDSVEDEVRRAFNEVEGDLATERPEAAELLNRYNIERIAVLEEWGRGTAQEGQDPLNIMLYTTFEDKEELLGEDETLAESQLFKQVSSEYVERMQDEFTPDQTMLEWFGGIVFGSIPAEDYEDSITFFMNQAQPNEAYSLTDRTRLELSDEGRVVPLEPEEEVEEVEEDLEDDEEEDLPEDILQFPQKQELIARLSEAFAEGKENKIREDAGAGVLEDAQVSQLLTLGEWGRGTGTFGQDPLSVMVSVTVEGQENPNQLPGFSRQLQGLSDFIEGALEETQLMQEWFSSVQITTVADNFLDRSLEVNLRGDAPQRGFNLTTNSIIRLEEGELKIEPVQTAEPEEPEPEEEPTVEEQLAEQFPGIPVELRQFAVEENQLEIPAGKTTKSVEPREIYDFEIEIATPGDGETSIGRVITEGIGEAVASQRYATEEPASTFPRTGVYVKWHLFFRGPSYINELYRDLVVFSGYISSLYDARLTPGKYVSFREFIYRLDQAGKRGGPTLVRKLPSQEAIERGLDVRPTLPDGREAPWLEPRQYCEVNEDNLNHSAWDNITEYLYQTLGEEV